MPRRDFTRPYSSTRTFGQGAGTTGGGSSYVRSLTLDAYGRVTAATSGTPSGGGGGTSTITLGGIDMVLTGPYIDVVATLTANEGFDWSTWGTRETLTDSGTDVGVLINELFEAVPADIGYGFWFWPGPNERDAYRLSVPLRPKRGHLLISCGNIAGRGAIFKCDTGVKGLIIDSPASSGVSTTAAGCRVEGIKFKGTRIFGSGNHGIIRSQAYSVLGTLLEAGKGLVDPTNAYAKGSNGCIYELTTAGTTAATTDYATWTTTTGATQTDGTCVWTCRGKVNGIEVYAAPMLTNVFIESFPGNGIYMHGHNAETPSTNCNGWRLISCRSSSNGGYGYWVDGADAQAGRSFACDANDNGQGGLYDHTESGNSWNNCLFEFNGHLDWPEHQHQLDLFSDNSSSAKWSGYVEGGGNMKVAGDWWMHDFNSISTPGFYDESTTPYQAGQIHKHNIRVLNELRPGGDSVDIWLNFGGAGTSESWIRYLNGKTSEAAQFMREKTNTGRHGVHYFWSDTLSDWVAGFNCATRRTASKWLMNRSQLQSDNQNGRVQRAADPSIRMDGHLVNQGDKYEYGGSLAVASGFEGVYATRDGMAYARWTASTAVTLGTVRTDSNGNLQRCTTAGTTGGAEPGAWSTTFGGTTADNTVTWTVGLATHQGKTITTFAASTTYAQGDIFVPSPRNGLIYQVEEAGNSGSGALTGTGGQFGELMTHNGTFKFRCVGYDMRGTLWKGYGSLSNTLVP